MEMLGDHAFGPRRHTQAATRKLDAQENERRRKGCIRIFVLSPRAYCETQPIINSRLIHPEFPEPGNRNIRLRDHYFSYFLQLELKTLRNPRAFQRFERQTNNRWANGRLISDDLLSLPTALERHLYTYPFHRIRRMQKLSSAAGRDSHALYTLLYLTRTVVSTYSPQMGMYNNH